LYEPKSSFLLNNVPGKVFGRSLAIHF